MFQTSQDILIVVLSIGLGLFFLMCSIFVGILIALFVSLKRLANQSEELMEHVNTYVTMPASALYTLLQFFNSKK